MRPDFIITLIDTPNIRFWRVVPTHTGALNWMFAHVEAMERRSTSAHLSDARLAQFKSDAGVACMTFSEPSSPQPAGGGRN